MPTTVDGECFCGAVRFTIELPTLFCGHCHCTMCRGNWTYPGFVDG